MENANFGTSLVTGESVGVGGTRFHMEQLRNENQRLSGELTKRNEVIVKLTNQMQQILSALVQKNEEVTELQKDKSRLAESLLRVGTSLHATQLRDVGKRAGTGWWSRDDELNLLNTIPRVSVYGNPTAYCWRHNFWQTAYNEGLVSRSVTGVAQRMMMLLSGKYVQFQQQLDPSLFEYLKQQATLRMRMKHKVRRKRNM